MTNQMGMFSYFKLMKPILSHSPNIVIGLFMLFLGFQSVYAETYCPPDTEESECAEVSFTWRTIAGGSTFYPSKSAFINAQNTIFQTNFDTCMSQSPPSSYCTLGVIETSEPAWYADTINDIAATYNLRGTRRQVFFDHLGNIRRDITEPALIGGVDSYIQCPDGYSGVKKRIGTERNPSHFNAYCLKYYNFYLVPTEQPHSCPNGSDMEGNPCNPVTGAKIQLEVDYNLASNDSIEFSRTYNSQKTGTGEMDENWSHNFSSYMQGSEENPDQPPVISGKYTNSTDACESGFGSLKNKIWNRELAQGTAIRTSSDTCSITNSNGRIQAEFEIVRVPRIGDDGTNIKLSPERFKTIIRGDGSRYVFQYVNGQWVSRENPGVSLVASGTNWIFTDSNNTQEIYNTLGQLLLITPANGREITLTYDITIANGGDGNPETLDRVTDSSGRSLFFSYTVNNGSPVLTTVTTPDGDITYNYSDDNNLVGVTYPDASTKTYHYEAGTRYPHHLTGITDEKGIRFATWLYDVLGRVLVSKHADDTERTAFYYAYDGRTKVTGALNDVRFYNFTLERGARRVSQITGDECRTCGNGFMKTRTYDNNGFLNGYTDWNGNQTSIVNNSRGLPVSRTEAVGTAQERTITTTWHSSLNLPLVITEHKRKTTFNYTPSGQLLTRTITDLATGESRTTTYTYHPAGSNGSGLIATIDGPRTDVNDITTYTYDTQDNLTTITNASGHTTQITDHDASGRPLSITDANGTVTTLEWDARGRLTLYTLDGRETAFGYDPVGQLTRVTFPDYSYLDYTYDEAQRLTEISDKAGNTIIYTLDKMGNRTSTTTQDSNGTIALNQSAVFDRLSHLKQMLGANGQQQTYQYDDNHNPLNSTDALSRQTQSNYDALDRLIKSIDPDTKETNLEYDAQDNLTKVTDARGLETSYIYNGFDEVISQTSPDTGTTTYTYDEAGNTTRITDARGITVTYTYDALNRVLTENYPDSTEKVTYRYDLGTRRKGRVYDMRDASGRTIFSYDTRGNNTYRRHDIDGYKFYTRYSYHHDNRLRYLTYPSGRQVLYTRDTSGRINRVRTRHKENGSWTAWQYLANTVKYQPFGDIKSMTYGNGLSYSANFDQDARLTQQTIGNVLDNSYGYNTVDNLVTIQDAIDSALDQSFNYDNLDRLNYETGGYGSRYFEYDAVGNQVYTEKSWTASDGSPRNSAINIHRMADANQIRTLNSQVEYVHDNAGNILTDRNGRRTFSYNDAGRLETFSYNSQLRGSYTYNAQGQRVKKARTLTNGNILTYYFQYDKQGQLLSEIYHNGTRLVSHTDYIWLEGRPIAQLKTVLKNNGDISRVETRYLHTDHLNTPRKATDENGTIVWRWDSDGYGYTQPTRDPDGDGKNEYVRLRFAGQYHDAESGLFYNYFRYYDPYTGRYVTSDPIGLAGGVNTYGYVGGNPTYWVDPLGLESSIASNLSTGLNGASSVLKDIGGAISHAGVYYYSGACSKLSGSPECAAVYQMAKDDAGYIGLAFYDYIHEPEVRENVNKVCDAAIDSAISNHDDTRNYIGGRLLGTMAISQLRGVGILSAPLVTGGSMIRTSRSLQNNTNLGDLINNATGLTR